MSSPSYQLLLMTGSSKSNLHLMEEVVGVISLALASEGNERMQKCVLYFYCQTYNIKAVFSAIYISGG